MSYRKKRPRSAMHQPRSFKGYGAGWTKKKAPRPQGAYAPESKFVDTSVSATIPNPADMTGAEMDPTTVNCLNAVPIGNTESTRDGRKTWLTRLNIRGVVALAQQANLSSGLDAQIVRVVVLQDTQTNGAQFNSEDVYASLGAANLNVHAWRNLKFAKRFTILKDHQFILNPKAVTWDGTNMEGSSVKATFKWNIPLNIPVIYTDTTALISSISDNSLHVMAWTIGLTCVLRYASRVRFTG